MAAKKPDPVTELADLKRLRSALWAHIDGIDPGGQSLGVGAIAGQLAKIVERIAVLEDADTTKEISLADQLADARQRRADGTARSSRRGSKRSS